MVTAIDHVCTLTQINAITSSSTKCFIKAQILTENQGRQDILVLPDSGNRAKSIIKLDIFKQFFPSMKIVPYDKTITTARRNQVLHIHGETV
jgi:hypothetical protein